MELGILKRGLAREICPPQGCWLTRVVNHVAEQTVLSTLNSKASSFRQTYSSNPRSINYTSKNSFNSAPTFTGASTACQCPTPSNSTVLAFRIPSTMTPITSLLLK